MRKTLQKKTEEWMKLERRTLEQRKKAEEFYEQELMDDITMEYLRNNKAALKGNVQYLIEYSAVAEPPNLLR